MISSTQKEPLMWAYRKGGKIVMSAVSVFQTREQCLNTVALFSLTTSLRKEVGDYKFINQV